MEGLANAETVLRALQKQFMKAAGGKETEAGKKMCEDQIQAVKSRIIAAEIRQLAVLCDAAQRDITEIKTEFDEIDLRSKPESFLELWRSFFDSWAQENDKGDQQAPQKVVGHSKVLKRLRIWTRKLSAGLDRLGELSKDANVQLQASLNQERSRVEDLMNLQRQRAEEIILHCTLVLANESENHAYHSTLLQLTHPDGVPVTPSQPTSPHFSTPLSIKALEIHAQAWMALARSFCVGDKEMFSDYFEKITWHRGRVDKIPIYTVSDGGLPEVNGTYLLDGYDQDDFLRWRCTSTSFFYFRYV